MLGEPLPRVKAKSIQGELCYIADINDLGDMLLAHFEATAALTPKRLAVSVLVLPSYRAEVGPELIESLAELGYRADLVRVETSTHKGRASVTPSPITASFRLCQLPPSTTPFSAMLFGLCYCQTSLILLASGGIRLAAEEVALLLQRQEETSAGVVVATRYASGSRSKHPWRYRILSAMVREYLRILTGNPLRDPRSGLKLFQRDALFAFIREVHRTGIPFDPHDLTLLTSRGSQAIVEVPVEARFSDAPFGISSALARHVIITPLRYRSALFRKLSRTTST